MLFLIPYERAFTLIGTTDVALDDAAQAPAIAAVERRYLCAAASRYTERAITEADVVWSYVDVRALYDDGRADPSAVTRDYHLLADEGRWPRRAFGGKITTHRRLAEQVMARLARRFRGTHAWTATEPPPGGDFGRRSFAALHEEARRR